MVRSYGMLLEAEHRAYNILNTWKAKEVIEKNAIILKKTRQISVVYAEGEFMVMG